MHISAKPKSMEIDPTIFKIVLTGIVLKCHRVKDIYYAAESPDVSSSKKTVRGSMCRKRKAQDSTSGRKEKVTEEKKDG